MKTLLPNPWLLSIGLTLLSYLAIYGCKRLFCIRLGKITGRTKNKWDDIVVETVEGTTHFFMVASAFHIGFHYLAHPPVPWSKLLANRVYFIVLMIQVAIWSNHLIETWISHAIKQKFRRNSAVASSVSLLQLLAKLILISIIFLFTLNNMGIKITTILAGLGVGGLAVALAVQKILGDLFSSLSIVLDKPFMVGDFIVLDSFLGEVEHIGLKTTRLRSLTGEQIIVSNSDLVAARIRNYQRLRERRVVLSHALVHGLSAGQIQSVVSLITGIVSSHDKLRFERCHFKEIGPTSLNFETVYWVLSDDYNVHMDLQQKILLAICQAFEAENLTFAYPTQTLHVRPTSITISADSTLASAAESNKSLS